LTSRIKGKEVQSWDGRRVATLSNDPVGLLEGAPLLVTVKQFYVGDNTPRALQLVSTNDWQPVGEAIDIQVPVAYGHEKYQSVSIRPPAEPVEVPPGPQGKNRAICSPLAIGVDQSRSEVVYCNEYTVDRYTLDQCRWLNAGQRTAEIRFGITSRSDNVTCHAERRSVALYSLASRSTFYPNRPVV